MYRLYTYLRPAALTSCAWKGGVVIVMRFGMGSLFYKLRDRSLIMERGGGLQNGSRDGGGGSEVRT